MCRALVENSCENPPLSPPDSACCAKAPPAQSLFRQAASAWRPFSSSNKRQTRWRLTPFQKTDSSCFEVHTLKSICSFPVCIQRWPLKLCSAAALYWMLCFRGKRRAWWISTQLNSCDHLSPHPALSLQLSNQLSDLLTPSWLSRKIPKKAFMLIVIKKNSERLWHSQTLLSPCHGVNFVFQEAGPLPVEAGSSTLPGQTTGMDVDGGVPVGLKLYLKRYILSVDDDNEFRSRCE